MRDSGIYRKGREGREGDAGDFCFWDSRRFYKFAVRNDAGEWKTVACYAAKD